MRRKKLPPIPKEVIRADGIMKIEYVKKLPPPKNQERYTAGLYDADSDEVTISIISHEPRREKWIIFFHELLHDLEIEGNVNLTEKEVEAISTALFSCFMRNDWALPGEK